MVIIQKNSLFLFGLYSPGNISKWASSDNELAKFEMFVSSIMLLLLLLLLLLLPERKASIVLSMMKKPIC